MVLDKRSMLLDDLGMTRLLNKGILLARRLRIVSHPRSGRSWLRLMLHDLGADPRFYHAGAKGDLQRTPDDICRDIEAERARRIVFLHRDPRDVIVSFFHHCRRRGVWDGGLSTFIREPTRGFERILAFNLGWLGGAGDFAAFMPLAYEDLRARPEGELARLVRFMGCLGVSDADIERAVANNSFQNMKARERSGELHARFGDRFTPGGGDDESMIVRRGVVGSHGDELSDADRAYCDELLARYDYFARLAELTRRTGAAGPREEASG